MARLFSAAVWTFIAIMLVPFFLGALVVRLITWPFDRRRLVLHLYSCFWACFYIYANPVWHLRVEGRQRLPWRRPAVLVANHASLIDILVLFGLYRPFKWVSKESVFRVPFLGWNMRLNDYVPLVRGDRDSIARMMDHCQRHLQQRVPVLLFPEGTRSPDGHLRAFKDGAFRLAWENHCPIIPIAIHGTAHVLPKHGLTLQQPMRAVVEVLEPLDPSGFESFEALREATRSAIEDALARRAARFSAEGVQDGARPAS